MLSYILLGFLGYQPMTGYELKTVLDGSTMHFWHAHHSQIYTTLRDLEARGLLTSEVQESGDRLNRRVYTITDAGRAELQTWLDRPLTELPAAKEELLVRVFFSARRDRREVLDELRVQRALHEQKLQLFRGMMAKGVGGEHTHDPALAEDTRF
jgi:DNA-binding PadR family transcriptional regulator